VRVRATLQRAKHLVGMLSPLLASVDAAEPLLWDIYSPRWTADGRSSPVSAPFLHWPVSVSVELVKGSSRKSRCSISG
jgi:hypothetical protein